MKFTEELIEKYNKYTRNPISMCTYKYTNILNRFRDLTGYFFFFFIFDSTITNYQKLNFVKTNMHIAFMLRYTH